MATETTDKSTSDKAFELFLLMSAIDQAGYHNQVADALKERGRPEFGVEEILNLLAKIVEEQGINREVANAAIQITFGLLLEDESYPFYVDRTR